MKFVSKMYLGQEKLEIDFEPISSTINNENFCSNNWELVAQAWGFPMPMKLIGRHQFGNFAGIPSIQGVLFIEDNLNYSLVQLDATSIKKNILSAMVEQIDSLGLEQKLKFFNTWKTIELITIGPHTIHLVGKICFSPDAAKMIQQQIQANEAAKLDKLKKERREKGKPIRQVWAEAFWKVTNNRVLGGGILLILVALVTKLAGCWGGS